MTRGLFLTFEGIEGCGKSTQAAMLAESLRHAGQSVLLTREPGGPEISEKIRALLLDPQHTEMTARTELLLYMASRAQHTEEWILPALERGDLVICDRYVDSSLAYQGAARSLGAAVVRRLNRFSTGGLVPDLTFLLDIPAETGMQRIAHKHADRMEAEDIAFHRRVRRGFLRVAKQEPARFRIIDSNYSVADVHAEILEIVQHLLKRNES